MRVGERCRAFIEQHCGNYDASHDISHIDRVVVNARTILGLSDDAVRSAVDLDLLTAIASLHDSFDHKYLTTEAAVAEAKIRVKAFLRTELGFATDTVWLIMTVIENMGYTAEIQCSSPSLDETTILYLHLVQDADRLDAIGAVGIARCFAFAGAFGRPFLSPGGLVELAQKQAFERGELKPVTAKASSSAISIFYDKLVFLNSMLKTPAGRTLGHKRNAFMLQFLDQFLLEAGLVLGSR